MRFVNLSNRAFFNLSFLGYYLYVFFSFLKKSIDFFVKIDFELLSLGYFAEICEVERCLAKE